MQLFMVLDEFSVLPAELALDSSKDEEEKTFDSPVACPSWPFDDNGWIDKDHYYKGDLST